MKKEKLNNKDVGFIEDAITVAMEECHCEIHAMNSYFQTGDRKWLQIADESRRDRTKIMDIIVQNKNDGQIWCWSKHKLKTIVGYIELGNRCYTADNHDKAIEYYEVAKKWMGVFLIKNEIKIEKN